MTDAKSLVRSAYAARVAGDVEGLVSFFSDDATFEFNIEGTEGFPGSARGKSEIAASMRGMIDGFKFEEWREVSMLAEGERVALHWRARVVFRPTGASAVFDVVDFFTIRDGKIVELRQSTDTAKMQRMVA